MNVWRSRVPQTIWPCLSPRWYRNNAFRLLMTWHDMTWYDARCQTYVLNESVTYITILKSLDPRHVTGLADICDQMSPGGLTVTSTIITCTCLPAFPRAYIAVLMGANKTASNGPVEWLPTDTMAYRTNRTEQLLCYSLCLPPPLWYNFQSAWSQGDN